MSENLGRYRTQLRHFLEVRGVQILAEDTLKCPNRGEHEDTECVANLREDAKEGDLVECPTCATSWDIFDVCGLLDGIANTRSTFAKRLQIVKDTLATVLPDTPPEIAAKTASEWTDDDIAGEKARQRQATEATKARQAEARELQREERRKQSAATLGEIPFDILGTADDSMTYFLDRAERLQALRLGSLTKTQLQLLAPLEWWISHFRGSRGKLDVDEAVDFIIESANGKSFSLADLRGRGAWRERDGRLCYHDGAKTYGEPDACRIYQKKARADMGLESECASAEIRAAMLDAAAQLSFETQADCARLLAWALLAPFCGALPWRPAGFLTGVSKSGKSTILNLVVTRLARPLFISGDSTSAFIRQETGNDCVGVVIDEAESQTEAEHRRMSDIFSLMRQSTSDDAPRIGKGSTTGRAITYMTRNMYLFSAITPGVEKQADAARMFVVDLKKPENDWDAVRSAIAAAFTEANCACVRAFTWAHLREIIDGAETIAAGIQEVVGFDTRYALLEGILWAVHWRVWRDRFPEADELREWLGKLYAQKIIEQPLDDASAMLDRLLTEVVPVFDAPTKRYTLEYMLRALATDFEPGFDGTGRVPLDQDMAVRYRKTCSQYGLYILRTGELSVALHRAQVARILGSTMQYHTVLARHPLCLAKSKTVSPTGETSRKCVILSAAALEGEPPI